MPKYSIYPLLFLSLLLSIFLMRHSQTSLTTILFAQPLRFLTSQNLTQQFCYGVPETDTYTHSDKERAQGFRNALDTFRNDDKTLTGLINENQPTDTFVHEYGDSLTPILAPWIVFFGISVVFCLGYMINWCCMNYSCCIPCACKCCLTPKTGASKKFFAILSIILMFSVIGIAIAGAVFASRVNMQSNATVCWGLRLLEKIENGSQEDGWIGFSPAVNKIDSIVAGVINAAGGLSDFNEIIGELNSDISEAIASTNDTQKKSELENQQEIASSLASVHDEFLADLQQIEDEIMNIRPLVVQVSEDSSQIQTQISNHQNLIKDIIKAIEGTLMGLFIANIVFSAVALTSIMFVCFGAKAFNKAVYGTWFMIGFLMLLGWLASTAIFGMTIVVLESCDVGDKVLKSSEFFNKTFNYMEAAFDLDDSNYNKTRDALYTCIHGDGDLAKEYNLTDTVGIFDQIFDHVDSSLDSVNEIDAQFSSFATELQTSINSINNTIKPIYSKFKGPQGLIDNSNCAYIKKDFVDLIDVTCTGIGSTFFEITVTYLVLSFIAFFGTMMLFCLAKRFTLPENKSLEQNKRDVPEIYEIEI